MNFSQLNFLQLNPSEWKIPQLTTSQTTLFVGGVGIAFALYLMVLLRRWWKRRSQNAANAPRMRPRGTSRVPADALKSQASPDDKNEVKASEEKASSVNQSVIDKASAAITAASSSDSASDGTSVDSPATTQSESETRRKYGSGIYWPVEPKTFQKKSLFEDAGEEYPWADDSDYAFGSATNVLSDLLPVSEGGRRTLTKTLRHAGYYSPHAWQNLSAVRYLGLMLPILFFGVLLVIVPAVLEPYMIAGLVVGPALGWALPTLYVRSRAKERLREIDNAMPDMLDLLNMCVSQGMTVPGSLRRVSQDLGPVYPALSKELKIVADQARVGHLTEALTNLADRVDTPEVHSFASLLIQTEEMGTSVSDALTDYSDNMREAQRQRADEKANAATFKLLFPTVLCLMPAVFLFLMGPALIELNSFFANGGLDGLDRGAAQAIEAQQ